MYAYKNCAHTHMKVLQLPQGQGDKDTHVGELVESSTHSLCDGISVLLVHKLSESLGQVLLRQQVQLLGLELLLHQHWHAESLPLSPSLLPPLLPCQVVTRLRALVSPPCETWCGGHVGLNGGRENSLQRQKQWKMLQK